MASMTRHSLAPILAFAATSIASAAAPLSTSTAPGYYRVMVGDFEVTALSDGTGVMPMEKLLTNVTPEEIQRSLERAYLKPPFETSVNAYLVNTGEKLVMIDAGGGKMFGPTLGRVKASLEAAGYKPEQVDEIYVTHMHGDHAGGLSMDGTPVFPNAVVRADQHDADHWLSEEKMNAAPAEARGGFQSAMQSINPYVKAGRFKPFEGNTQLIPGVQALASHGHTPGHTTYMIESKGEKMVFWGDLMHVAAVQFPNPSATIQFDSDSPRAAEQRKLAYADAAKHGYLVGVAHVSFPGIGRLRSEGEGYVWVPVNYSPVK